MNFSRTFDFLLVEFWVGEKKREQEYGDGHMQPTPRGAEKNNGKFSA